MTDSPVVTLELCLRPDDRPILPRPAATRPVKLVWYDDAESTLVDQGRIVEHAGDTWRLLALHPGPTADWLACTPAPVLTEAPTPTDLAPFDATPVAAFEGQHETGTLGDATLDFLHGTLRGVVQSRAANRLRLAGPAPAIRDALTSLRVAIPRASLPAEALATARGTMLPPRHLGAPILDPDAPLGTGLAQILSHLLDVLLHWTDAYRRDPVPETVHQARVATRRLRSALSIYRPALPCPELDALNAALRDCAATLGAARDWDVFLAHTGARLETDGDPRMKPLLRAARRRQAITHAELAAYLASPAFPALELALALAAALRPWEQTADPAMLDIPTAAFATTALDRRLKHVRRRGKRLDDLTLPELHELRKDCKRLRYAAEFFAPCFPGRAVKPFLKRLAALQEELGLLNDTAVAAQFMAQLGRPGRGYAGGFVEGWSAATTQPARRRIKKTYKPFRATPPFWLR